ncbi:MarR family winged helix-turn-helix transcriptional regulator [Streptococcus sp. H31]|uniref:MarR family winged helix-turn-helix transcriptional regulator n=1 Tax=Streptococcus huangxiaojuni TaxID=3237239 RepID=UPI0034A50E74
MAGKKDDDWSSSFTLDNHLCFSLYVCSREFISSYDPFLSKLNLTYTQYVTMTVLWEEHQALTKHLKERLFLDSGTLTPVLKKLEEKGLVTKERSKKDARDVVVTLTETGKAMQKEAQEFPEGMRQLFSEIEQKEELNQLLHQMMTVFQNRRKSKV